jgi:membrane-bound lytic murein transglycosylase B
MTMIQRMTMVLVLACTLAACSKEPKSSASAGAAVDPPAVAQSQDLTPEQLGELGARISKDSAKAKQILSEHGLDEKTFEQKIRKVTEDPEASKRYAAAFEKAKAQA